MNPEPGLTPFGVFLLFLVGITIASGAPLPPMPLLHSGPAWTRAR